LVLYPLVGQTNHPNAEGLSHLEPKFGYFSGVDGEAYNVQQAIGLYPTSGIIDDWVYTTFGAAAYTFELGTNSLRKAILLKKLSFLKPHLLSTMQSNLLPPIPDFCGTRQP
jgi:hypothetical protein